MVSTMDKFFKTDESFELTKQLLEVVNYTTNDFLFVWDIQTDTNWFFGDIDKEFHVREQGSPTNKTSQMMDIIYPADRKAVSEDLKRIADGKQEAHDMNYRWIDKKGNIVWVNCRGKVIRDKEGNPYVMVGRVSEEAVRHLYNPLTGLWNKTKLKEDLKFRLFDNQGYLMLLDIDGLAAINLSHGRKFGDELLKEIADLLESTDIVEQCYHIDHNNFAVIINSESEEDVKDLFAFISEKTKDKCTFTASAVPIDNEIFMDASQIIDSVSVTLKKAKNDIKEQLAFFSADEIGQRIEALTLLEELKESVQNGFEGFEVYYQPQVKSGSYELYGVEALLRYTSKTRGRIFPDAFIPLLEQSRLIEQVGMWVLKTALEQCKKWRKKIPTLRVSVNFSTVQFEDRHIGEKVVEYLKELEMMGDCLTVELTESIQLHESEHLSNRIKYLKAYGIGLAIDDFGTGYSNLGYLKQLDVNEIKIDRSFVSGIEKDTYNYKLISNVIEFAKMNSIHICCEGVETSNELAILEVLQPDIIQGYLFDKPCTAEEIERKYIKKSSKDYIKRTQFIKGIYLYKEKIGVIHFDPKDILRENNIGLWVIRIGENGEHYEMYADDTMERILGIDRKCTPTQCYEHWHSRIHSEFVDYVHENVNVMVNDGKMVQLKYPWHHPTLGEVLVRSSGKRVKDADGMVVLEGYHRILTDVEGK